MRFGRKLIDVTPSFVILAEMKPEAKVITGTCLVACAQVRKGPLILALTLLWPLVLPIIRI